ARRQVEVALREDRERVTRLEEQLQTAPPEEKEVPRECPRPPEWRPEGFDRRRAAEVLVFAWKEAVTPEAKAPVERAMLNLGLEPIGERGEALPFDGACHACLGSVFEGDRVKV